eukprot:TRINITY_DN2627_c0_g1_i5.p1 TRINITY_DN2627_c0_g1~~TRINITY_DN2627_c0_g1_i5.p1  ORF type:complete len:213 (-),score=1.85 TRINITY_DN2627_c0_g1_i5:437-1075(-)
MEYSGLMQDLIKRANNLISRDKLLKEKLSPYSPIERLIAEPLYQVFAYPILLKNVIPLSSLNLDSENVTTAQKNWKKTLFKINFRSVIDHLQLLQKEISSVLSISPIRHILDTRVCWYKTDTEKVAECELVVFDKVIPSCLNILWFFFFFITTWYRYSLYVALAVSLSQKGIKFFFYEKGSMSICYQRKTVRLGVHVHSKMALLSLDFLAIL